MIVDSDSLIPGGDSTLLFTNAGMNQFKDVFLGQHTRSYKRAVTSQKCLRAGGKHNDLENVGYTARHHTFFEMLGNFSFGDYFKDKACELAWTFITDHLKLDPDRLYITVFQDDHTAFKIWHERIGIDAKRIFRFGEKDNFWSMGDTGPCGPCSEIFYDQAPDGTLPNKKQFETQDDRFMEIWNLVFMEFMQHQDGSRQVLPAPSIDTGMGLERITSVIEGKTNNFDTSIFRPLLTYISQHSDGDYFSTDQEKTKISQRVLADHIRAIVFLIHDQVLPSKEGRGYVLRRILRRAMRHGRNIDFPEDGLSHLSKIFIAQVGAHHPTLVQKQDWIFETIQNEEKLFAKTIDRGMHLLTDEIDRVKKQHARIFPGDVAFHLYETFGFPVDMTSDVLREHDLTLDQKGFEQAQHHHSQKAKGTWKKNNHASLEPLLIQWQTSGMASTFLGYDQNDADAKVLAIINDDREVQSIHAAQSALVLLDRTPFYGAGGGQVGDTGQLNGPGGKALVSDTIKLGQDYILHDIEMSQGKLSVGDKVQANIDTSKRRNTARNHTATHMLHATLKEVLGDHVSQKGSLVTAQRLRFDFTHPKPVSQPELDHVQTLINTRIAQNDPMVTQVLSIEDAKKSGAVSQFGEKYGEVVRVLSLGNYSKEFCGGTHVKTAKDIGTFILLKESSISAGVRRIEALTGDQARAYQNDIDQVISKLCASMQILPDVLVSYVAWLTKAQKALKKGKAFTPFQKDTSQGICEEPIIMMKKLIDLAQMPFEQILERLTDMHQNILTSQTTHAQKSQTFVLETKHIIEKPGLKVLIQEITIDDPKALRANADRALESLQEGIVILGCVCQGRALLVAKVSKAHLDQHHAGKLIELAAPLIDGSGGGKAEFAQAGGKNPNGLTSALDALKKHLA